MANSISALNPENWKPIVQDYLNNMLVAMDIANTKCVPYLNDGDAVNFPYVSDVRVQDLVQGTDLTIDAISATQDTLTVDQSRAVTFQIHPVQEKQAKAKYGLDLAYQAAYQLRNDIDQAVIVSGVNNAATELESAAVTTSASSIYEYMTEARSSLVRANAGDGEHFAVMPPEEVAKLEQSFVANGFVLGDKTLERGFQGSVNGFKVYASNNTPSQVVLAMGTQPTNGDTFTLFGITWTWVTDGTAANPGEINIGANVADAKAILKTALNGTTPPSAGDYVQVSIGSRRKLQNAQLEAATFSGDNMTITAYGRMSPAETFTAAGNVFGDEETSILFGRSGAISLGLQMQPELYIRDQEANIGKNYITHTLYGVATFERDKQRLVTLPVVY